MRDNILSGKNVLIADDNPINQMVVKHTLLKLGANADIAVDGAEAIEKFRKDKHDLILMDIQMPRMDGFEVTAYIRKQLGSNVPIIAMTALGLNGEDEKCFECGMNDFISKPFTIEKLSSTIEKVLSIPALIHLNPYVLIDKNISVDLSMLYEISGEDHSYINLMIRTFLESMPNTVKKINECLAKQNWDELYQAAHFAKSTLSVIKVSEMFDAVREIEVNAKNRTNLHFLPELVAKVNRSFKIAEGLLSKKF